MTGELLRDFWIVFEDFLKHSIEHIKEFDETAYYDSQDIRSQPADVAITVRLFGIICKAALKAEDAYAIETIKYIYKTYHRKEYNQLKRFTSICYEDIITLARMEGTILPEADYARILGMAKLLGIRQQEDCRMMYNALSTAYRSMLIAFKEEDEYALNLKDLSPEEVALCRSMLNHWKVFDTDFSDDFYCDEYEMIGEFISTCFEYFGFDEYYMETCERGESSYRTLTVTLALLRRIDSNLDITLPMAETYSFIYRLVKIIVKSNQEYYSDTLQMFGLEKANENCMFHPEKIVCRETAKKKEPASKEKSPALTENEKDAYIKEIEELRRQLEKKEAELRSSKLHCRNVEVELRETESLAESYKAELAENKEELVALRNYVYNLSEEDVFVEPVDLDKMKQFLLTKNIVIVGGHTNWVNKLKAEFPKWKFYDANVARTNDLALDGTEKLYFFTNHLSHSTYDKYIALVRERKIPFGYIHSVNMDAVIRTLYNDLFS